MLVKKIKSKSGITMTLTKQQSKDGVWNVRTTTRVADYTHIDIQRVNPVIYKLEDIIAEKVKHLDDSLAYFDKPKDQK